MYNGVSFYYSDDEPINNPINVTINTKEVSAQEAAAFYVKHLDEFKSKIVYSGEFEVLDIKSRWFVYLDHHTDDYKIYTEFTVNGRTHKFDSRLNMGVMRMSDMEGIRAYLKTQIVDKLTDVIRDEVLKDGMNTIIDLVKDAKRLR